LEKDLEQIPQRRLYLVTRSETCVLLCLISGIIDPLWGGHGRCRFCSNL